MTRPFPRLATALLGALLAASTAALPVRAADVFTMAVDTDRFANVRLQVKVTAPDRAAYLQEGTQYKVDPNWQSVDSILCDQTTRDIEVWANPSVLRAHRGQVLLVVEFALLVNNQMAAHTRVDRDISGGGNVRGFAHLVDRDFQLVINRNCR
ncbi:MAG: hypothetical protein IT563_25250 [Alphaproteobacteria bacterium]|nr:hypothetical protein [Alphaproteobacteria bacterium]